MEFQRRVGIETLIILNRMKAGENMTCSVAIHWHKTEQVSYISPNLQAIVFATFSQLVLHSSSAKKLITDSIHSCKITDKPRSCRSKKRQMIITTNSSASEVEKIEYLLQRKMSCQELTSTELKTVWIFT